MSTGIIKSQKNMEHEMDAGEQLQASIYKEIEGSEA